MTRSSVAASLVFILAACGGGQTEPKAPEPVPGVATTAPTASPPPGGAAPTASAQGTPAAPLGPSKPWKEMSLNEKKQHMKVAVMPKMAEAFQGHDKAKFAEFTCITCHGPSAKSGNFQMPSPALPKLYPADGFKKHQDKPEMLRFMKERVMPDMVALLGAKPYDPATHQGFGCNGCHTIDMGK